MKTRTCPRCEVEFDQPTGRGLDRLYCSRRCSHAAAKIRRRSDAKPCAVTGCEKRRRSLSADYCEAHYVRLRRTGTLEKPRRDRATTEAGYVLLKRPDHPLSTTAGWVSEHRMVLFDQIGAGPHFCHWCATGPLEWPDIVVDHLNEQKDDNRPDNLVPACNACNRARGSFIGFMSRLQPERLDQLFGTLRAMMKAS